MARHALHAHRPRRSARRAAALATLAIAGTLGAPQVAYAGEYGGGAGTGTGTGSSPVDTDGDSTPDTPGATTPTADECDGLSARLIALDKALADEDTTADEAASLASERPGIVADLALCLDLDVDTDVDAGLKLSL